MKEKIVKFFKVIANFLSKVGRQIAEISSAVWRFLKNNPVSQFLASSRGIKTIVIAALILGIAEIAFGILIYGFHSKDKATKVAAGIVPFPAAVVNFGFISYSEYLNEREYIHHFYNSTGQADIDFNSVDSEILNQLAENRLITFEAFLFGEKVKKSEVTATFDQIVEQNGGKDQVEKVLSDLYGLNVDQFMRLMKTQILRDKINSELIARVEARHILVRVTSDSPPEKIEEARQKALSIKNEITNGLDFAEAAKKYSEDTGSAEQGGLLESFAQGEMVAEFSVAAFSAKVGDISDPVRTDFGWHIIKVEKKSGKINSNFTDWLNTIKKNSLIIKLI